MKDQIVSFEVAKLASQVGFYTSAKEHGLPHGSWYNELGSRCGRIDIDKNGVDLRHKHPALNIERRRQMYLKSYYACTQSLIHKWLREERDIHITLHCCYETVKPYYEWTIQGSQGSYKQLDHKGMHGLRVMGYEQCLEDALRYALELLLFDCTTIDKN